MSTLGFLKTGARMGYIAKITFHINHVSIEFAVNIRRFWGEQFSDFCSKGNGVAPLIHMECWALKAFQTLVADLRPAASGPMTAGKHLVSSSAALVPLASRGRRIACSLTPICSRLQKSIKIVIQFVRV